MAHSARRALTQRSDIVLELHWTGLLIEVTIERLGPEIEAAFAKLFPEQASEKTHARLRWRFADCPHGSGYFAVARDREMHGQVVGVAGATATHFRDGDREFDAYQIVDLVVDEAYRGRGVFSKIGDRLFRHAQDEGRKVIWGFPNRAAAPGWFGRLGWTSLGMAPFMIRPLRTGYFVRRIFGRSLVDFPLVMRSADVPAAEPIYRFGPETDGLWSRVGPEIGCSVQRDSTWLNWRLVDKPESNYRTLGSFTSEGELRAFLSWCQLKKHGGQVLYIMEAMAAPKDMAHLVDLLRLRLSASAAEGAEVALCWCPAAAPNRAAYRQAGFFSFPSRFRPIDIHFGAKLNGDWGRLGDPLSWYVSYLDSDTV